jgi:hypothetical protein
LGQSAIWLKFCVFILCTKICRAYPKEFIESASFAAAAGASAHANAQHGVPVRRRSNSIGTFADLFFMLFSIISMPFWRDWSANGVGSCWQRARTGGRGPSLIWAALARALEANSSLSSLRCISELGRPEEKKKKKKAARRFEPWSFFSSQVTVCLLRVLRKQ